MPIDMMGFESTKHIEKIFCRLLSEIIVSKTELPPQLERGGYAKPQIPSTGSLFWNEIILLRIKIV